MIKVENVVLDGRRCVRVSDGIHVNFTATEQDVDTLLSLLTAWKKGVTAMPGDLYMFEGESKPLKVIRVAGFELEDLVFFEDGTCSKQKHLGSLVRV